MALLRWCLTIKPKKFKEKNMKFNCRIWNSEGKMQLDTLEAPNRGALIQVYQMLGQRIEIIEEAGIPQAVPQFENGNATANQIAKTFGPAEMIPEDQIPVNDGFNQQTIVPFRAPPRPETQIPVPVMPPPKPIMFEDGGVKFKIENGIVSKKVWRDLTDEEKTDFRITPKEGDNECKGKIQKLDWIKIEG
jgi:hypothetical protein